MNPFYIIMAILIAAMLGGIVVKFLAFAFTVVIGLVLGAALLGVGYLAYRFGKSKS